MTRRCRVGTWGALLASAPLFVCSVAFGHHDPICAPPDVLVNWQADGFTYVGHVVGSPEAICAEIEVAYKAHDNTPQDNSCAVVGSFTHETYQSCRCTEGQTVQGNFVITPVCGAPGDPCEETAGNEVRGQWSSGGTATSVCGLNSSGMACTWEFQGVGVLLGSDISAGRSYYGTWVQTASSCEGGAEAVSGESGGGYNCIERDGEELCVSETGTNCGKFNGQPVCVESVPPGNCIILGDGGYACDDAAGTPPTPDVGVPGIEAPPDGQVVSESGDTVNYYNETTVTGSTTVQGPPGEYEPPPDGDDCTPGVDCPTEWVDRNYDPGNPGQFPAMDVPPSAIETGLSQDVEYDYEEEASAWLTWAQETFPFSLIVSPLEPFSYGTQAPTWELDMFGASYRIDLSEFDELIALAKGCESVLLIWGFWLLWMETIRRTLQ